MPPAIPRGLVRPRNLRALILAAVFALVAGSSLPKKNSAEPQVHAATIGHGVTLHYVDEGTGVPVIFVHGYAKAAGSWPTQ